MSRVPGQKRLRRGSLGGNRKGGRSSDGLRFDPQRVAAFNDAVIAIAITLLVLDISPDIAGGVSNAEVWDAIWDMAPNIAAFAFSFWVIARFWTTNLLYFQAIKQIDMRTLQLDVAFLFVIALLPFPTALLASSHVAQASIIVYAGTLATASFVQAAMWRGLLNDERRNDTMNEFMAFFRFLQYIMSGAIFLLSIPIAFLNVYAAMAFWVLFGFTRLFSENSPDSLRPFEERYIERQSGESSDPR